MVPIDAWRGACRHTLEKLQQEVADERFQVEQNFDENSEKSDKEIFTLTAQRERLVAKQREMVLTSLP